MFGAVEMSAGGYPERTRGNPRDSDATIWFGDPDSPGGRTTLRTCARFGRPVYLVIKGLTCPSNAIRGRVAQGSWGVRQSLDNVGKFPRKVEYWNPGGMGRPAGRLALAPDRLCALANRIRPRTGRASGRVRGPEEARKPPLDPSGDQSQGTARRRLPLRLGRTGRLDDRLEPGPFQHERAARRRRRPQQPPAAPTPRCPPRAPRPA
jgi:hypothetical protein